MRSERGWRSIKPNTFAGILYRSSSMRQLSRRPIVRLCTDRSWLTRNERFSRHLLTNLRSFALTLRPNVLDYVSTTDPFPDELTFSRFTRSTQAGTLRVHRNRCVLKHILYIYGYARVKHTRQ